MKQIFQRITRFIAAVGGLSLLGLFTLGPAAAQTEAPGRVARLAEFAGEVRLANDYEDWQPIGRNYPITAGDNVWVSDNGRAEFDVGAFQLWASAGANAYFERFDDHNLVVRLNAGALAVRIRNWEAQDALRVQTADGEVVFNRPGFYLVDSGIGEFAYQRGGSLLSVNSGQAEVIAANARQWVERGNTVIFDRYGLRYDRYVAGQGGFESWALARSSRYDNWSRNVDYRDDYAPWMVGVYGLDDYGRWDSTAQYGRVWYPSAVSADWAPYRDGRWVWVRPWGWTWVDEAPWGFAPFHYGRWVRIGARWAWAPGSYATRPIYAPALVTFFGGSNWSVSLNVGGPAYSWVPLGWGEPYAPWYNYSPAYWRNVNRPYVRNWAEAPWRPSAYVNAGIRGAVTVVPGSVFTSGRPVRDNYVRNIRERDLRGAPPAQVSELVPRFRPPSGNAGSGQRGAPPVIMQQGRDPNPVVRGQPMPPPVRQGPVNNPNPGFSAPAQPMPKRPGTTDFVTEPPRGAAPQRMEAAPRPPATMPDRGIPRPVLTQPERPRTLYTEEQAPRAAQPQPQLQPQPQRPAQPVQPVRPQIQEQRPAQPQIQQSQPMPQPQRPQQMAPQRPAEPARPQMQQQQPVQQFRPQQQQAPQRAEPPRMERGAAPMEKRQ